MGEKIESKALEANLQQTRNVEIVIPERQYWFISLSADKFGFNQRVVEFIRELNHPYHNLGFLCDNLKKIANTDFWFYAALPEADKALDVLLDIHETLLSISKKPENIDSLIQSLATFMELVCAEELNHTEVLNRGLEILEKFFSENKQSVIKNANSLKKRLTSLVKKGILGDRIFDLFRNIAYQTIEEWQSESNIDEWVKKDLRFFPEENIDIVKKVGSKFYVQLKRQVTQAKTWDDFVENVMLFSDIADYHRGIVSEFLSPISQFHYIIYLLRMSTMEHQREYLIWDLNKLLTSILSDVPNREIHVFVDDVFKLFEELLENHKSIVLDCIATIGKEFALFYNKDLLSQFEDNVIRMGFTPPGRTVMTADWQLKADPNHLKSMRVWLDLIEVAPNRFEKLLPALIINIKFGGVLIFDTDLFQRNISKLLNADIERVFKPIKELCKLFPVFFNEIGAEGELRDVTTEIDTLSNRQDKLMHFLRKQIHIDSNNKHLDFLDVILGYWIDGDFEKISSLLPPDIKDAVANSDQWVLPMRNLINEVSSYLSVSPYKLLSATRKDIDEAISHVEDIEDLHKKKLQLFVHVVHLLRSKYFADVTDIAHEMSLCGCVEKGVIDDYLKAEKGGDNLGMLKVMYQCMAYLNTIVTNKKKTEEWEAIYYKHHVAFGIPSMYGQYHEEKFEALGHIFKMEKAASNIMRQIVGEVNLSYITANTLKRIIEVLTLFYQGLNLDGITNKGFESNLKMLRFSLSSISFSLNQYINIFQFLSNSVKEIIRNSFFRQFDGILKDIVPKYFSGTDESDNQLLFHKQSESFYRDMLSSSFLLQDLDNFIAEVLNSLNDMAGLYTEKKLRNILDIDVQMMITSLNKPNPKLDNKIFLGSKGFFLKSIYPKNFPVPPGFILTTELFRRRDTIMDYNPLRFDFEKAVKEYLSKIEHTVNKKFGDINNPLLLSVRSGAPISMPGAMNTFLNVGMNDSIAESLSQKPNMAWTAWDCYKRFLQSWGQAFGVERSVFDNVITKHQDSAGAEIKDFFNPQQMREIALEYKELLKKRNIPLYDDVYEQLFAAINIVFDSWDGDRAQLYRKHLQIADEWGTAVIIQSMVFGNIHRSSGTGVVFTYDAATENPGLRLNGDYSLLSQGDDVVGGITKVLPVSEHQEKGQKGSKSQSLQAQMPRTYQRLFQLADRLVNELHFGHQEIEFTFESSNPYDLFILQTRDQQIFKPEVKIMYQTPPPRAKLLGKGIPIGASILNGLVIFDLKDLAKQKELNPEGKFIYVSSDTTPDDLPIVFECDGLITSRGGATSHAAVTAGRLGKVCLVSCNDMIVYSDKKICTFGKRSITSGYALSVDAHTGSIYDGHYDLQQE